MLNKDYAKENEALKGSDYYDEVWARITDYKKTSPGSRWQRWLLSEIVSEAVTPDEEERKNISTILDIGCGDGDTSENLSKLFPAAKITGVDFSETSIKIAKMRCVDNANLNFVCADAKDKKIWGEKYDIVSAFEVLEHVEDWQSLLNDIVNTANKYIILSFPTGKMRAFESKIGHLRNFKINEVESYVQKRFDNVKVKKVYYAGFPFYSPIGQDLLNHFYKEYDEKILTSKRSALKIIYERLLYIALRFFSTKNQYGEQFVGVFEKINKKIL